MAQKRKTSKAAAPTKRTPAAAQTRNKTPRRREIWALVCFVLAVFTFLGYFNNDGLFINFFCVFMKGLIGKGFYILPPALLAGAVILGFHRGRPVKFRVVSALLLPVMIGAIFQLFSKNIDYALNTLMFKALWNDGKEMTSGGIFGGTIAVTFKYLFSKTGAAVVLIFASIFFLLIAFNQTLGGLWDKFKNREKLEYIPEPEGESPVQKSALGKNSSRFDAQVPLASASSKRSIDIPIDDQNSNLMQTKKEKRTSFFNSKPRVKTPDQFVNDNYDTGLDDANNLDPENAAKAPADNPDADMIILSSISSQKAAASAGGAKNAIPELAVPGTTKKSADSSPQYTFPPLSLLTANTGGGIVDNREEIRITRERLETTLHSFGINSEISNITRGPTITRYETELEAGVKLNKLTNLADDIALSLGTTSVRIAAIPNKISTVGIEVPNKLISKVYLRDIIESLEFKSAASKLTFAVGKNISGEAIVGNVSKLPHMLVAGTTGSGKSVCLNSLILSILYKATPDEVKFIMVDPKMVEFKIYNGIPHLLVPVVTEAKKAAGALQWAVTEMMKRYRLFSETGARDLASYNEICKKNEELDYIPQIVVVIDELADLMLVAAKEVEEAVCRVAQMGRAAGVHLIIATQSPRADVITGLMKANIPSRIALKVSSSLESRIILDSGGNADKLVGNGDMLFAPIGTSKPVRIQGTWVSDEERENIVEFIKKGSEPHYSDEVISQIEKAAEEKQSASKQDVKQEAVNDYDELLPQAVEVILESNQASVSMLQRRLKLGYSRAARLVDQMEERGIVGPFEGSKPRQILITKAQWQEMQFINGTAPAAPEFGQTMFSADDLFGSEEDE